MPDRLRTINEAAEMWLVKPRTVRRWIFLRKVDYVKVGGRLRISEAEISRVIAKGTVRRLGDGFPFEATAMND